MDTAFCLDALEEALKHGKSKIFNTDQGSQGRGRTLDNIFVERFCRSLKKFRDIMH
jgi:putative transposase